MKKLTSLVLITALMLTMGAAPASAAAKKPAKVKISSITSEKTAVTLKWKKAKNAKKYQVYQLNGKKYKKIKTLKAKKLTVKNLKKGTTYKFKVRAINGKKKGKFSKVASIVTKKDVVHSGVVSDPTKTKISIGDTYTFKLPSGRNQQVKVTSLTDWYVSNDCLEVTGTTPSGGSLYYLHTGDLEYWEFKEKDYTKYLDVKEYSDHFEFTMKDLKTSAEFSSCDEVGTLYRGDWVTFGKSGTVHDIYQTYWMSMEGDNHLVVKQEDKTIYEYHFHWR